MHKGWCMYFGYSDTITHGYNCAKILFYVITKKKKKKGIHTSYKNVATKGKLFIRCIDCRNYKLSPDALQFENSLFCS